VRVVVRADVARALPTAPAGVRWVVSAEDPMLGPAGSLRAAAREGLGDGLVAVSPVDLDPAAWRCVSALAEALIAHGADVAKPAFGGRRGHPVVVRAAVLAGYARGDAAPLREVLRAAAWRAVEVPVDDAAVLGDFDTPEALARGRVRA
jgi:CTP:molybdopterin cytidylyltransferase MocA